MRYLLSILTPPPPPTPHSVYLYIVCGQTLSTATNTTSRGYRMRQTSHATPYFHGFEEWTKISWDFTQMRSYENRIREFMNKTTDPCTYAFHISMLISIQDKTQPNIRHGCNLSARQTGYKSSSLQSQLREVPYMCHACSWSETLYPTISTSTGACADRRMYTQCVGLRYNDLTEV